MLFILIVSLYTSRLVLNTLGVVDYGIYNVVGGVVTMLSLVSNSLSASVSRFLTFELGRGNTEKLKRIFSTSVTIYVALAIVIFMVAESLGLWFLNTQMNIPHNRMTAANWVFQCSLFSFLLGLVGVPYNASIISHERMKTFAYIGILNVLLYLLAILFIAHSSFAMDNLIVYSLLLMLISFLMQGIYLYYCPRHFEECKFHFIFDKELIRQIAGFAGWNLIGCTAGLLKDQGVNILLNIFIGPIINAARGIANQVNGAVNGFVSNYMTALNPQITKSYALNEREYLLKLVERGSRFAFYIMLLIVLPILLETQFVLTLWLKHFPAHTIAFVQLILILSLIDILSNTLITTQLATGRIRNYQLAVGGTLLMNFPLSYFSLKNGMLPETTIVIAIAISICCLFLRLIFLKKIIDFSIKRYLSHVCGNVLMVTVTSMVLPLILYHILPRGFVQFIVIVIFCIMNTSLSAYYIGCSSNERTFIFSKLKIAWQRVKFKND
jgi:O-antigen/teichoic acid export membrane protein